MAGIKSMHVLVLMEALAWTACGMPRNHHHHHHHHVETQLTPAQPAGPTQTTSSAPETTRKVTLRFSTAASKGLLTGSTFTGINTVTSTTGVRTATPNTVQTTQKRTETTSIGTTSTELPGTTEVTSIGTTETTTEESRSTTTETTGSVPYSMQETTENKISTGTTVEETSVVTTETTFSQSETTSPRSSSIMSTNLEVSSMTPQASQTQTITATEEFGTATEGSAYNGLASATHTAQPTQTPTESASTETTITELADTTEVTNSVTTGTTSKENGSMTTGMAGFIPYSMQETTRSEISAGTTVEEISITTTETLFSQPETTSPQSSRIMLTNLKVSKTTPQASQTQTITATEAFSAAIEGSTYNGLTSAMHTARLTQTPIETSNVTNTFTEPTTVSENNKCLCPSTTLTQLQSTANAAQTEEPATIAAMYKRLLPAPSTRQTSACACEPAAGTVVTEFAQPANTTQTNGCLCDSTTGITSGALRSTTYGQAATEATQTERCFCGSTAKIRSDLPQSAATTSGIVTEEPGVTSPATSSAAAAGG